MENTAQAAPSAEPIATPAPSAEPIAEIDAVGEAPAESAEGLGEGGEIVNVEPTENVVDSLSAEDIETLERLLPKYKKKLTVNGEEKEVSFEEMTERLQKEWAAEQRFRQASDIEKNHNLLKSQVENLMQALKENPLAISEKIVGAEKVREMMEEKLYQALKEDQLSPEERENNQKIREYEQMKKQIEAMEQEKKQGEMTRLQQQYEQQLDQEISGALETANLPRTPYTVQRLAALMYSANQKGIDASASELAEILQEQYKSDIGSLLGGVGDDSLLNYLGEDIAGKIRKQDVARLKTPQVRQAAQATTTTTRKPKRQKMTMDEWSARNQKILEGLDG
jgi:hypothetical protein